MSSSVVEHPLLQLWPEVSNQTLQGPCERLSESTDSVALDLLGQLLQHVDLADAALALLESVHDLVGPSGALTARCALTVPLSVRGRMRWVFG
jgi:hypothetical protein